MLVVSISIIFIEISIYRFFIWWICLLIRFNLAINWRFKLLSSRIYFFWSIIWWMFLHILRIAYGCVCRMVFILVRIEYFFALFFALFFLEGLICFLMLLAAYLRVLYVTWLLLNYYQCLRFVDIYRHNLSWCFIGRIITSHLSMSIGFNIM